MFQRMQEKRNEGGFTLIELLIVIVILAILAAIVVFAVTNTTKNAAAASCESDAKSVETAVSAYKAQMAAWPGANVWSALTNTATDPAGQVVGPWLRAKPSNAHYTINFDGSGHVSADRSTVGSYVPADSVNPGGVAPPCQANAF